MRDKKVFLSRESILKGFGTGLKGAKGEELGVFGVSDEALAQKGYDGATLEKERLKGKLVVEIEQLEAWLASQERSERGNISIIPTIKALIGTRKRLLSTIKS